eukprot:7520206-Lingulodinium_polyedra.AAC.1
MTSRKPRDARGIWWPLFSCVGYVCPFRVDEELKVGMSPAPTNSRVFFPKQMSMLTRVGRMSA